MLSFHRDPIIKKRYLARAIEHRKAGLIIRRRGWRTGRSCTGGCTLENCDNYLYKLGIGLPEWLQRLEDCIFSKTNILEARYWPERFLESIPVGVDVEDVQRKLSIIRMDRLIESQRKLLKIHESKKIKNVINSAIISLQFAYKYIDSNFVKKDEYEFTGFLEENLCFLSINMANEELERISDISPMKALTSSENAAESAWHAIRQKTFKGSGVKSALLASSSYSLSENVNLLEIEAIDLLSLLSECK